MDITVKIDTREQTPWIFEPELNKRSGYKTRIAGSEIGTLSEGDYSLIGFEDQIRIERKVGFGELFGNFCPKEHKDRFEREMERLRPIPYKYLLVESNLSKDIMGLSVGQMFKGPPCSKVFKWLNELQMDYGINVMFVGDCGKKVARTIFENFIKRV